MRAALTFAFWLASALASFAACSGTDLRATMSQEQRNVLAATLDATPFANGNHWRATRGDDVLHLIGTMHLDDPRLDPPFERLSPLLETADLILLEMTSRENAQLQDALSKQPDYIVLKDTSLPELLDEDSWDQLTDAMKERGMPAFMVAKFQPWYVTMLLSLPACLNLSQGKPDGLDARIEALAQDNDIPLRALEKYDTAFQAFETLSREDQLDMLRSTLGTPGENDDLYATMLAAYFEEAHSESWYVNQLLAAEMTGQTAGADGPLGRLDAALLGDRNRAWIPVILDALATTDGTVMAAFGAAHLGGSNGVLHLLAHEGFELERLPF